LIIFDKEKYVESLKKDGLKANDRYVDLNLKLLAEHYIKNTTYKPAETKEILKKLSKKYFYGFPESLVDEYISERYAEVKKMVNEKKSVLPIKEKDIILYKSEMEQIAALGNRNLQEVAFAFLVVNKHFGYKWTNECNSDVFRIANNKSNGVRRTEIIHTLVKKGIVKFTTAINFGYAQNRDWIAKTRFSVPINVSEMKDIQETAWMRITNYDNVMLYLGLYLGDSDIGICADCGCPIIITGNSKKYCSDCAKKRKEASKKMSKKKSLQKAS